MTGSAVTLAPDVLERIAGVIGEHEPELIALRRRLHGAPELSFAEHATTEALLERLGLEGLDPQRLPSGTGVFCDIGTGGPLVALRADIDALAMPDAKDVPYRSQFEGVAHACGHDVHTAAVVGAGVALVTLDRAGLLPGRVRLLFEPGEESVPGGAVEMVELGLLADASAVLGLHCDPKQEVGRVGSRSGPITSASDWVQIDLFGPGGHTARPHLTVDLVDVAATVVRELPRVLEDRLGGHENARMVFGAIHAGSAANVIPATATLSGSLRTPDADVWEAIPSVLQQAVADVLTPTGATWDLQHVRGVPPVVNDEGVIRLMAAAARCVVSDERVTRTEHSWGGDSFGWMSRAAPGAFLRLGVHDPRQEEWLDLHHSLFDVDERAIAIGARVLAAGAVMVLNDAGRLTRVGDTRSGQGPPDRRDTDRAGEDHGGKGERNPHAEEHCGPSHAAGQGHAPSPGLL